jgi:hypothetical protein
MKVRATFPAYATKNCDFVSGQRLKTGRILDLQVDVETLPPVGMLCVHENTVKMMVTKLGWKLDNDDALDHAECQVLELKEQLAGMQEIIGKMQMAGFEQPDPMADFNDDPVLVGVDE